MQTVYINYPNPAITSYSDASSRQIGKHNKQGQRCIRITHGTLSEELSKFAGKQHRFGSNPATNDMYIDLDLNDPVFEMAVLDHIQILIGRYYKPLSPTRIQISRA